MAFAMWVLSFLHGSRLHTFGFAFPLVGHSHGSIDSFLTKLNFSQFLNALNM